MQELKNCLGLRIKTDPAQAVLFVCAIRRSGGHRARASGHPTGNGHRYVRQATAVLARAGLHFATVRAGRVPLVRSAICRATDKYV